MISSSLRYTQRHHLRRIGKRCLPSNNTNARSSRFIFHHGNTTRFIAGDAANKTSCILHHVSKRRNYNAILRTTVQQCRMMTSDSPPENVDGSSSSPEFNLQDANTCTRVEDLGECYSSPLSLLESRNIRTVQRKECEPITINNETWYTAAYETNFGDQHSGTFGDLLKKLNPTLANEERMNINGINYYKSKEAAMEAAAARVIDLFSGKEFVTFGDNYDSAVPLRYCVEEPEQNVTLKSTLERYAWQLHVPILFLDSYLRVKFGSGVEKYSCFIVEVANASENGSTTTWYTATFKDPLTSEKFHSGLVGPINAKKYGFASLQPALDEVEVRIKNGKVFYPDARHAKHAAAARAIDCYLFREGNDALTKKFQLCLEEPYSDTMDKRAQRDDYEKLLLQLQRGSFMKSEDKSFKSVVKSFSYQLHAPMNLLENCFRKVHGYLYDREAFKCYHVVENDREWFTATFTDPNTSEVFTSGLVGPIDAEEKRGATLSTPLCETEVRIMDGKVYYAEEKYARHAAAARAIDCFLYREGSDSLTKKYQLCLEAPYIDAAERDSQYNDYDELLCRRRDATDNKSDSRKLPGHVRFQALSDKSFTSEVKENAYKLHIPMQLLSFKGNLSGNEFITETAVFEDLTWHTATFTDPCTSEVFTAGIGRRVDVKKKQGAFLSPSLDEVEKRVSDGKVYYRDKTRAKHAAAARAIDCYLYRETGAFSTNQLCLEDPYEEGSAHEIDYDALAASRATLSVVRSPDLESPSKRREMSINSVASRVLEDKSVAESKMSFKSVTENTPFQLHVPMNLLEKCFRKVHGYLYDREAFKCYHVVENDREWFTATFTDPNTSEVFTSGLVGPIDAEEKRGATLSTPLCETEVRIMDGKVYYAEEKYARHAAAARAIDCFLYREGSDSLTKKYQLCLEAPYIDAAERDSQYNDYDELLRRRRDATGNKSDAKPSQEEYCKLVASRNAKPLDSVEDMMPYLDESDEDFTIVSRTYTDVPTRVDQKLSTLGRIAEIWAETPTNAFSGKRSDKTASFTKTSKDPTDNVLNWFKRVDHTPSNFEQAMAFSQLCNKTLLALASEDTEKHPNKCADIQREAKSILDKLTSISSQFAAKDESVVNAETLNAYIQCLNRVDAEESATVAEDLLKRMSEGKDSLPPPNAGTFNTVMKLWSLVDGDKGKNGVNDTFSLLQHAAVAREDLRPNRVSFQILLSANAKENNHFKYDLALASLERIKALSQDLCGEAFTPMAEDYHAALKKTATNCLHDGDYYPPWVWHGRHYDGGFKVIDDDKKREALDMEKWLKHAEEMGVSPSEDMYFRVIEAWTGTGSLEGLIGCDGVQGAEDLAKKAVLRSGGAPNMKIFYPIIAAWSLCGERLGPDRVKEWIDQISSLGVKPDLDLQVAYFVAVEKWQSKLIASMLGNNDGKEDSLVVVKGASTDGDVESLFKAAHNCSRYLNEIASDENGQGNADIHAFTAMLRYSIKACSRASHSTLLLPDSSTPLNSTQGVEEMAKVARRISLRGRDSANIDEDLVNEAGKVYTEFASQLRKLDSTRNEHFENNEKCYFAERIADVESSLRSYEFQSRRLASYDELSPESNDIRHNLYRETLRGCAGVKLSTDYGHVLRICTLIMDCLSWHHELTRDLGRSGMEEDLTDIFSEIALISGTCVKNPYERMNVLRSIYERASDFFPKKNPNHESSYARVDRAALLGSMRRSLGDSEMTDSYLSSFEEGKQGHRRRSRQRGNS
ncbi:hypothetical protein ACHAXM_010916 [Skeletonema potamos]